MTSEGGERDTSVSNIAILNNSSPENVFTEDAINGPGFTGRPALTPDGKLLVVPRNRGDLAPLETLIINPETNQIVADLLLSRAGATQSATVTPDGRFAYVSVLGGEGGVWVINLETLSTVTVIPTPDTRIFGVTATPDGRYVFATHLLLGEVSASAAPPPTTCGPRVARTRSRVERLHRVAASAPSPTCCSRARGGRY